LVEATSLFSTAWSDPGADTFDGTNIFPDGVPNPNFRAGITSVDTMEHAFAAPGCNKSVSVTIDDDDGGSDSASTSISVGSAEFLPPMTNQHMTDRIGNRSVLPVRIRVLDCAGNPVGGLSPTIELVAGDRTQATDDISASIAVGSVSAADTDGVMRPSGDAYMYNMAIDLPQTNADYTVIIRPYGAGSSATLRHKIHAL
jgi:hypothetical protein